MPMGNCCPSRSEAASGMGDTEGGYNKHNIVVEEMFNQDCWVVKGSQYPEMRVAASFSGACMIPL